MARRLQTIAQLILDAALKSYEAYPANQFASASGCPFHAVSNGKIPSAPGERAYTHILSQDFERAHISRTETTKMAWVN